VKPWHMSVTTVQKGNGVGYRGYARHTKLGTQHTRTSQFKQLAESFPSRSECTSAPDSVIGIGIRMIVR
jgi:hypothetical protein